MPAKLATTINKICSVPLISSIQTNLFTPLPITIIRSWHFSLKSLRIINRNLVLIIIILLTAFGITITLVLSSTTEHGSTTERDFLILSLIIGGLITGIIYHYQEKGEEQRQEALMNIDLLSNGALDRKFISQRSFLYHTLFRFEELKSLLEDNNIQFNDSLGKLKSFINDNYFSNMDIEEKAKQLLSEFSDISNPILRNWCIDLINKRLQKYRLAIDSLLNEAIEKIELQSIQKNKEQEWVIVLGSKYDQGKIKFPSSDIIVAKDIKNKFDDKSFASLLKMKHTQKIRIIMDRDIYFSDERYKNLIVVGGTNINKITKFLNDRLRIQYVKMKNYNGDYDDYLVDRSKEGSLIRRPNACQSDFEKTYGSIQIVKNPYNENKSNPTYIIVVFGLDRSGTAAAGKEIVNLWQDDFKELQVREWAKFVPQDEE